MPYILERQGDEFLVNTLVNGYQFESRVLASGDGGFIVIWIDESGDGNDTSAQDVRAQRFDAQGAKLGDEFGINTTTFGTQILHSGTILADGRFVVTWSDQKAIRDNRETDVLGQIFNADGTKAGGEFLVTTVTDKAQLNGDLVALTSGGFVAAWTDNSAANPGLTHGRVIKAQIFDGTGAKIGGELSVNSNTTDFVSSSTVAALSSGGFIAAFVSQPSSGLSTIEFQIFDGAGNKVGPQQAASQPFDGSLSTPQIAALASGFVVTWAEQVGGLSTSLWVIKAQLFNTTGQKVGGEILVESAWTAWQTHGVAALPDGDGFVITWSSFIGEEIANHDVRAQVYGADGAKIGEEVTVSGVTAGMQMQPKVATLSSGDILITWTDNSASGGGGESPGDIKARIYSLVDAIVGTPENDVLAGTSGDDHIQGLGGDDLINGGTGADRMRGGAGNDTYIVDNIGDVVIEAAGDGSDYVAAQGSYVLTAGAEVELLSTTDNGGTASINLNGNEFAQVLVGNAGVNYLDGGGGADLLVGLAGNDTYIVDGDDRVAEGVGNGFDYVATKASFVLDFDAEIELVSTTNNAGIAAINLTGNAFNQVLLGNDGANILNGGGGGDLLVGLGGNDTYIVDNDDRVSEAAGGGSDYIAAKGSFILDAGSDVELLSTTDNAGTLAINLTGNALNQVLVGNAGANYLDGSSGADLLVGLLGNDTYILEGDDQVIEEVGGGSDYIAAKASFVLTSGAEVEVISTTDNAGTAAINLTGNALAQSVIGNAGANVLRGGGGADTLLGLGGDDFLYVDNDDIVIEAAGGGHDTVLVSNYFQLTAGAHVELLSTTDNAGTAGITLWGNELSQAVVGNAGANQLNGGGGNDVLQGLGGADVFVFNTALGAGNVDTILDFVAADDHFFLDHNVFTGLAVGPLNGTQIAFGSAAMDANDRIIYNTATGQLFFDADGNGGGAAVLFAALSGAPVISSLDFQVI